MPGIGVESTNGEFPRIITQGARLVPTITPEKIGCVMAEVQSQIDGLQLYLIELGLAKARVSLHGEKGWGMEAAVLREVACVELMSL